MNRETCDESAISDYGHSGAELSLEEENLRYAFGIEYHS
jgi:hypothetical protein